MNCFFLRVVNTTIYNVIQRSSVGGVNGAVSDVTLVQLLAENNSAAAAAAAAADNNFNDDGSGRGGKV